MAQKKNASEEILNGVLWKNILIFALPLAMTNIVQQLFNSVDVAVVGQFCGSEALAAVGSTGCVVNLCITIFSGLAIGANVVLSRMIGENRKGELKRAITTAMFFSLLAGIIFLTIGEIGARPLLEIMGTPENILEQAVLYLRIYIAGSIFRMVYNFEAAIFRAGGDTKKPMYCLLGAGILNVFLNLFFVLAFHMGVVGVAIATVISDAVSAGLLFFLLTKEKSEIRLHIESIEMEMDVVAQILGNGVPAALQGMLFNIANIIIQSGINALGADTVAATTVALNFEVFAYYMIMGFANASMTYNSQNYGAGNLKRCVQATRWCLFLGMICTYILCGAFVVFRYFFCDLYTSDPTVIQLAAYRIFVLQLLEGINLLTEVFAATLRALGKPMLPTILAVIFTCLIRVGWILFIFPLHHTFSTLVLVYPVTWSATAISMIIAYLWVKRSLFNLSQSSN